MTALVSSLTAQHLVKVYTLGKSAYGVSREVSIWILLIGMHVVDEYMA